MRVTEVNLIPERGYLIELRPICVDHHDRPDPELSHPETLSEGSTLPPYPHWPVGCACWASAPKWDPVYCYHGRSLGDWGEWGEEGKWCRSSPYNYVVRFQIFEVLSRLRPRVETLECFPCRSCSTTHTVFVTKICVAYFRGFID